MRGPAIFLDTETTDREDDRQIIKAAWLRPAAVDDLAGVSDRIPRPILDGDVAQFNQRYKPDKPIEHGAMAVHHILPEELEDCPPWHTFGVPEDVTYIVGHNIDFDWRAACSPAHVKRVCTDAMARWIWQDCDSYSQSALLYRLLGPKPSTRRLLQDAHSALADVTNNALLLEEILKAKPDITTWSALYAFSEECRIPRVLPFGMWKGSTLEEVVDCDRGYVDWMLRQDWLDEYVRKGLEQALNPPEPEPAEVADDDDIPF